MSKYPAYKELVKLKLRQIFQEASLWGKHATRVEDGFRVNMLEELLNKNTKGKVNSIIYDLREILESQGILRKNIDGELYVVVKDLKTIASIMLNFRKENMSDIAEIFAELPGWNEIIQISQVI
ncbi:MAG: hypothetical protein R6V05_08955 [Candidatus Brocadiia bacterium]